MSPSIEESQKPAKEEPSTPKVGDKVAFLPGPEHAFNRDGNGLATGGYQWVVGLKMIAGVHHVPGQLSNTAPVESIKELSDKELEHDLYLVGQGRMSKSQLVLLRPKNAWPAVVDSVNPDGTLHLLVEKPRTGMILGYQNVPADHEKTKGHSWHLPS